MAVKQRSSYPLRFTTDELRVEVKNEAKSNCRSLNAELCVLLQEAMIRRKEIHHTNRQYPRNEEAPGAATPRASGSTAPTSMKGTAHE
ncbi:MAG: Arc family DNA-binding protein [Halomonas sp.]|nr:Arc family DNA-binding protein [Halomonas sp.]